MFQATLPSGHTVLALVRARGERANLQWGFSRDVLGAMVAFAVAITGTRLGTGDLVAQSDF
jgi:hypothetical protein